MPSELRAVLNECNADYDRDKSTVQSRVLCRKVISTTKSIVNVAEAYGTGGQGFVSCLRHTVIGG